MHCVDSFIVPAHKIVCAQNIFWVVVPDVQQAVIFPAFRFFGTSLPPPCRRDQPVPAAGLTFSSCVLTRI